MNDEYWRAQLQQLEYELDKMTDDRDNWRARYEDAMTAANDAQENVRLMRAEVDRANMLVHSARELIAPEREL